MKQIRQAAEDSTDLEPDNRLLHRDEEHSPCLVGDVVAPPPQARRDDGDHDRLPQVDGVEHLIVGSTASVFYDEDDADIFTLAYFPESLPEVTQKMLGQINASKR